MGLGVAPQLQKMVLGHTFAERQCSSQEVHKDGIGCGLAKDEGSQGDQKDSITDQCPPAVGQRTRVSVIFFPCLCRLLSITVNIISHPTSVGRTPQASHELPHTKLCDPSSQLRRPRPRWTNAQGRTTAECESSDGKTLRKKQVTGNGMLRSK